jgi:hypothetical protein
MTEVQDIEVQLGVCQMKTKFTARDQYYGRGNSMELELHKRSQNGKPTLIFRLEGKDWGGVRTHSKVEIPWAAVEIMMDWLSGGPRNPSNTKTSSEAATLKRQMRDIRLCASQFKSAFKRLTETLEQHELEAELEKESQFPEASRFPPDFEPGAHA